MLRGADIVIVPDHDAPGYAHAEAIARMSTGIAKRIRMLKLAEHWAECPKAGDISDWLEAGHTREELDALIAQANPWSGAQPEPGLHLQLEDFYAYMPQHSYIFAPSRELWPAASVNARLPPVIGPDGKPITPATWLDANAAVEQMTWAPGEPMLIKDRLVSDGGWIERPGCSVFNLYRPPALVPKPATSRRGSISCDKVFPDEADHIVLWLAHRVQRPHEKINHALVLGGKPGIGKDTILEPVKQAVGPWNFADVSPKQVLGRFNGFLKSVILRINEARDLGDFDRYAFYDHMKAFIAAPPDVLRVDEKHLREYSVLNLCGVVITTNHKTDGIYLPADDRRHFVAWSNLTQDDFADDYWRKLYRLVRQRRQRSRRRLSRQPRSVRLRSQGAAAEDRSLLGDRQRQPRAGRRRACRRARRSRAAGHRDARSGGKPSVLAAAGLRRMAARSKNARRIPHRFEDCGYVAVRNPNDSEGRWKISGKTTHDLRQGQPHRTRPPRRRLQARRRALTSPNQGTSMKHAAIPQGPMSKADHLDILKRAIHASLAARVEYEQHRQQAECTDGAFELIWAGELTVADVRRLYLVLAGSGYFPVDIMPATEG